jgi:hypothetical protein
MEKSMNSNRAVKQAATTSRRRRTRTPRLTVFGNAPKGRQKELFDNPHVQAGAIAHLAVMQRFSSEQSDTDECLDPSTEVDKEILKAMGMALGSVYAFEVLDVVQELAYRMQDALIRARLLAPDCGEKWQKQRVE